MPSRNSYLRGADDYLDFVTPGALINPESNIFNKAFEITPLDDEKWNDWMQWEGEQEALVFSQNSWRSCVLARRLAYQHRQH